MASRTLVATPATAALAQSTSAHIFGQGPAGAKVGARNDTGAHRSTTVRDNGRHDVRALPKGTYTVTLTAAGVVTDTRRDIPLMVGRGAEVDFACPGTLAKQAHRRRHEQPRARPTGGQSRASSAGVDYPLSHPTSGAPPSKETNP